MPRRRDFFDYTKPVDGSDPRTDWHGLHALSELPSVLNPANGWVQNTNAWPYRAAGRATPRNAEIFPRYMDTDGENFRGIHAQQLLEGSSGWTLERLQSAAYDSYQPGFAVLIPPLLQAYDALPGGDPRKADLAGPIGVLRTWNYHWSADSVAQSLGIQDLRFHLDLFGGGSVSHQVVASAAMAVATGMAETVVCWLCCGLTGPLRRASRSIFRRRCSRRMECTHGV